MNVFGKVFEIVDGLLDCVVLQAGNAQVWIWVTEAIESVLQNDRAPIFLLSCKSVNFSPSRNKTKTAPINPLIVLLVKYPVYPERAGKREK